ncbi:hypothetical protein K474DRAFT_1303100 [Panus rudis PR-1116 ss-1]|nr:hypothetical protein K474DRAFT_1303100 [Panus rudis PR-1116 ss-1]
MGYVKRCAGIRECGHGQSTSISLLYQLQWFIYEVLSINLNDFAQFYSRFFITRALPALLPCMMYIGMLNTLAMRYSGRGEFV